MSSPTPEAPEPTTRIPLDGVTHGHLRIKPGVHGATLSARPKLGDLLHGRWRREPKVTAEDGTVTLAFPRLRRVRSGTDEITLNGSIPWDITIEGGAQRVGADLRLLKLRSLRIAGSVSQLTLVLGKPDGDVHLDLESADRLTIRRPEHTQVRIHVTKGAAQVAVDDQNYGALGGDTVLTTGPVVSNSYYLKVTGARRLRVTTI